MAKLFQCNVCGKRNDETFILTADNSFIDDFAICEKCIMDSHAHLMAGKKAEPGNSGHQAKFMGLIAEAWVHGRSEGELGDECKRLVAELEAQQRPPIPPVLKAGIHRLIELAHEASEILDTLGDESAPHNLSNALSETAAVVDEELLKVTR